jgi:hypothetical protein
MITLWIMMQKKLWSKEFIAIIASSLFNSMAFYALLPTLPVYLLGNLKMSHSSIGLIIGAFFHLGNPYTPNCRLHNRQLS